MYKLPAFLSARKVRYIDNSAIDPVARGQNSWLVYGVIKTTIAGFRRWSGSYEWIARSVDARSGLG